MIINSFTEQYQFLSNFHPAVIMFEGQVYPTAEHAYQAAKSEDLAVREMISMLSTPGQAKRTGGRISLRANWDTLRYGIMYEIVRAKFQLPFLRFKLHETGDAVLIGGNNWHDNTWGICMCPACASKQARNWLGNILAVVRTENRERLKAT